jgi:sterol carrier protein 2
VQADIPIGATGLAQCAELTWHLRGWANNRLVKDTKYCLQHNLGLGGAVVVTVYKRADGKPATLVPDQEVGKINHLGYNPATQAKGFTLEQAKQVLSKKSFSDWAVQDVQNKVQARF